MTLGKICKIQYLKNGELLKRAGDILLFKLKDDKTVIFNLKIGKLFYCVFLVEISAGFYLFQEQNSLSFFLLDVGSGNLTEIKEQEVRIGRIILFSKKDLYINFLFAEGSEKKVFKNPVKVKGKFLLTEFKLVLFISSAETFADYNISGELRKSETCTSDLELYLLDEYLWVLKLNAKNIIRKDIRFIGDNFILCKNFNFFISFLKTGTLLNSYKAYHISENSFGRIKFKELSDVNLENIYPEPGLPLVNYYCGDLPIHEKFDLNKSEEISNNISFSSACGFRYTLYNFILIGKELKILGSKMKFIYGIPWLSIGKFDFASKEFIEEFRVEYDEFLIVPQDRIKIFSINNLSEILRVPLESNHLVSGFPRVAKLVIDKDLIFIWFFPATNAIFFARMNLDERFESFFEIREKKLVGIEILGTSIWLALKDFLLNTIKLKVFVQERTKEVVKYTLKEEFLFPLRLDMKCVKIFPFNAGVCLVFVFSEECQLILLRSKIREMAKSYINDTCINFETRGCRFNSSENLNFLGLKEDLKNLYSKLKGIDKNYYPSLVDYMGFFEEMNQHDQDLKLKDTLTKLKGKYPSEIELTCAYKSNFFEEKKQRDQDLKLKDTLAKLEEKYPSEIELTCAYKSNFFEEKKQKEQTVKFPKSLNKSLNKCRRW